MWFSLFKSHLSTNSEKHISPYLSSVEFNMCLFQNKLQLPWVILHGISLPDKLLRKMFALGIRWSASGLATREHFNTDSQLQTPQREWMSTSWYQTQRATLVGEKTRSKSLEENVRIEPLMTKDFSAWFNWDTMYSGPIVQSLFNSSFRLPSILMIHHISWCEWAVHTV